jgi:3'(2'), 5'-bisphosphate nucleotidase
MQNPSINSLLLLSIQSAMIAGSAIMQYYTGKKIKVKRKKDFSPITSADREAHEIIANELVETGLPLLSEEGEHEKYEERKKWGAFWLVDPLDGTKEFLKKNGEFTVNIALIEENLPSLGVVYAPALDKLFFGTSSFGSYYIRASKIRDFKPDNPDEIISMSEKLPLRMKNRRYTVIASRSHRSFETRKYISALKKEYGEVNIISSGSSLKFCLVAEGSADIYPRFGPTMEWDTAAGQAVAVFSGCSVKGYDSSLVLTYNKEKLLNPWFIVERVTDNRMV